MTVRHSSWVIWRWPLLLASLIVFGLLSALLGQGGIWWVLSWIALAIPLALIGVCIARRRRGSASGGQVLNS